MEHLFCTVEKQALDITRTSVWYNCCTNRSDEMPQETIPEQMPFTSEEWEQTPTAVQEFILSVVVHVQRLKAEVAPLRE